MKKISKSVQGLFIIVLVALTLTACFNDNSAKSNVPSSEHATLKIMTMDYKSGSNMTLGVHFQGQLKTFLEEPFQKTHPNVNFQYIYYDALAQSTESFHAIIEQEKPDMFILDEFHFNLLGAEQKLVPLDNYYRNEAEAPINPTVIDHLKAVGGDGQLYGLTPFFDNLVMYYNKSLFDRYQVPYPNESTLSWDDIFTMVEQIHTMSSVGQVPVYGIYQSPYGLLSGGGLFQLISESSGVDKDDSAASNQTLQNLIGLYRSQSISLPVNAISPTIPTILDTYAVMEDQAAITIEGRDFLSQWLRHYYKAESEFPWGIVKLPAGKNRIKTNKIFAINQQSTQQQVALEFLKFIHQSDTIQSMAVSDNDFELPTVAPNLEAIVGVSLDPFYSMSSNITFGGHDAEWEQQWNKIYVSVIRAGIEKQSAEQIIEDLQKNWSQIP